MSYLESLSGITNMTVVQEFPPPKPKLENQKLEVKVIKMLGTNKC